MVQKAREDKRDKDKDRASGDVKSSVHAPTKKDGKGGAYTWQGGAEEHLETPHDANEQMNKVMPQAKGGDSRGVDAGAFFELQDDKEFPSLGKSPNSPERKAQETKWLTNISLDPDIGDGARRSRRSQN